MANSVQEALSSRLATDTDIGTYIGGVTSTSPRIYYADAPQSATLPYIRYQRIAGTNEALHMGTKGEQPTIQYDVFDKQKENGRRLAEAVVDSLEGLTGTISSIRIKHINTTGPTELRDPDFENLYHYVVDANVENGR